MSSKETTEASTALVNEERKDGLSIIAVRSKVLQKDEAEAFGRVIAVVLRRSSVKFVLDLSMCEYVSSEGLGQIARLWKKCHDDGVGQMAVVLSPAPQSEVRSLFDIIGLSRIIGSAMRSSVDDAVSYLKTFA